MINLNKPYFRIFFLTTTALSCALHASTANAHRALQENRPTAPLFVLSQDTQERSGIANSRNLSKEEAAIDDKNTIVVTGTMIRGIGASAGTNPIQITQEEILRSGYSTVSQVLQTLPQNFIGGYNEHNIHAGGTAENFMRASSPDLRGLGNRATLVLINGRRVPSISQDTSSIDISSIPVSIIERIDVLPDGASAVYGADAVAGVVNIILKKKFDGAETAGRFAHTTEGGLREINLSQTFGTSWNSGSVFIGYDYFDRTNLYHADRKYTQSDDLTPFGGTDRRWYWGTPANIINPVTFLPDFVIPDVQTRQPLLPSDLLPPDRADKFGTTEGSDLYPETRRHSVFLHAQQELLPNLSIFLEGRYGDSRIKALRGYEFVSVTVTNDYPFYIDAYGDGRPLYVAYNFKREFEPDANVSDAKSYNATAGVDYNLSESLQLRTHGSFSRETTHSLARNIIPISRAQAAMRFDDPTRVFNIFGNGDDNHPETLAYLRTNYFSRTRFSIYELQSLLEGELIKLPGGEIRFAFGGNFRKEKAWTDSSFSAYPEKRFVRDVWSGFGELFLPLVSEQNRMNFVESLTVSLSGRLDSYKDRPLLPERQPSTQQSDFNPKIGLSWEPLRGYRVRGTYGTSFVVPSLADRVANTSVDTAAYDDPRSPSGRSLVLMISGTAPDLKNETSTNWSLGLTVAPPQIPSLRLDATFYAIKFKDRITRPSLPLNFLALEEQYGSLFIRNPTVEQVRAACALSERPPLGGSCDTPELVQVILDSRVQNLSRYTVRGTRHRLRSRLYIRHRRTRSAQPLQQHILSP